MLRFKIFVSTVHWFLTVSFSTQVLQGWDFTDLSHSMLTSLPACIRFEIFFYCRFDLLCYLTFVGFVTYFIVPGCRFD